MFCLTLALLAVLTSAVSCVGSTNYEGYQVIRFTPQSQQQLDSLRNIDRTRYDVWKEPRRINDHMDVMIGPTDRILVKQATYNKIQFEVMIDNVQSLINRSYNKQTSHSFLNLTEIYNLLDSEAAVCSDCEVLSVGRSTEGRDIKLMKISRPGTDRRAVWLDATIHAREWLATAVATCFIDRLINEYGVNTQVTELRDNYDWYILNVVNPDGYDYTWTTDRTWRKTRSDNPGSVCVGTDANRNYDYVWDLDVPCSESYRGAAPESEPEISQLTDLIQSLSSSIDLSINLHTYGQMVLRPWGYTGVEPPNGLEQERVGTIGRDAINANSTVTYVLQKTSGTGSGMSFDWSYGTAQIVYSYIFELRDEGTYGFIAPPEEIQPTCNEVWAGVHAMAMNLVSP